MKTQNLQTAVCQSCAMPMADATESDWGTNADGSLSDRYCSDCWQNGVFTDPQETMEGMAAIAATGWAEQDSSVTYSQALDRTMEILPTLQRWS